MSTDLERYLGGDDEVDHDEVRRELAALREQFGRMVKAWDEVCDLCATVSQELNREGGRLLESYPEASGLSDVDRAWLHGHMTGEGVRLMRERERLGMIGNAMRMREVADGGSQ